MSKQEEKPAAITAEDRVRFVLAGKALLTVRSKRTGVRLTFYIQKPKHPKKGAKDVRFVSVQEEQLQGTGWGYVGFIIMNPTKNYPKLYDGEKPFLWGGHKSAFTKNDYRVQGWDWLWRCLANGDVPLDKVDLFHKGVCGRCGRKLTTATSMILGLGPVCHRILKRLEG